MVACSLSAFNLLAGQERGHSESARSMRAVKGSPATPYQEKIEVDVRSWGINEVASNGWKSGSASRRTELFSLDLLPFSILLTFDQQFCSR